MQLQWIDVPGGSRSGLPGLLTSRSSSRWRDGRSIPPSAPYPSPLTSTGAIAAPPDATALVASHGSAQARGWVWQVPDPIDPTSVLWAAHFAARTVASDQLLTAIVAALAGQVSRRRGRGMVVAVEADDVATSIALADARLELSCWFRTTEVADPAPCGGDPHPGSLDEPVEDLPMPHRHGARWALGDDHHGHGQTMLRRGSAVALVAPAGPGLLLADPVVGGTRGDYGRAVALLRDEARRRGLSRLAVAVGPGEPQLDDVLAGRGFERSVDWWWLGR